MCRCLFHAAGGEELGKTVSPYMEEFTGIVKKLGFRSGHSDCSDGTPGRQIGPLKKLPPKLNEALENHLGWLASDRL